MFKINRKKDSDEWPESNLWLLKHFIKGKILRRKTIYITGNYGQ